MTLHREDYQWAGPEPGQRSILNQLMFIVFLPIIIIYVICGKVVYIYDTFGKPEVAVVYERLDETNSWQTIGEKCRGFYEENHVTGNLYQVQNLPWASIEPKPEYVLVTNDGRPFPIYAIFTGSEEECYDQYHAWKKNLHVTEYDRYIGSSEPEPHFLTWDRVFRGRIQSTTMCSILDSKEIIEPLYSSLKGWD